MASASGTVRALVLGGMVLAISGLGLPGAATACVASGQFALMETGSGSGVRWRLTRGGEPFFVKGVAGPNQSRPAGGLAEFASPYGAGAIAAMGGNALKTYGSDVKFGSDAVVEDYLAALQPACDAGVAVALGLDLLPYDPL